MSNYHIVPDPAKGWAIKKEGALKASAYAPTQRAAEKIAGKYVSTRSGGDIVIHRRDGKIRSTNTMMGSNRDPFPPRDHIN